MWRQAKMIHEYVKTNAAMGGGIFFLGWGEGRGALF
jgi:hypothetical protein